MGEVIRITF